MMRFKRIAEMDSVVERPEPVDMPAPAPIVAPTYDERGQLLIAEQLVSLRAPGSYAADQYRTLRHTVERLHRNAGLQVVAITSAKPGDGKSVTALNLAAALAQARDARVLIVDADLRRPTVAQYLGLGALATPGLAEAISESTPMARVVKRLDGFNLWILPAGSPQSSPYELLNSPRLEALLMEARKTYEFIIVDTPPILPFPDGRIVARLVDGYLVIVAAHKTPRKLLEEGISLIDPAKLLGVVFNGDDQPRSSHYGYYCYYTPEGRDRAQGW